MDKQTGKLIARIAENLPDMNGDIMQGWIDNPKGLQKALKVLCPPEIASVPQAEAPLDTIVRIDRWDCLVYPDWANRVLHRELETAGPEEYDLSKVELHFHPEQKCPTRRNDMTGEKIYQYLKKTDSLKNCLGLKDAVAIQQKGLAVFQKLFGENVLCCWKSTVENGRGRCFVPCVFRYLQGNGVYVVKVDWNYLDIGWPRNHPAARFVSA